MASARNRDDAARVPVATGADLRTWLTRHHSQAEGVWLVTFKKEHADYLPYDDIVRGLLAFGWIDSLPRALDDDRTMLWIAPRKKGSRWSARNKAHVAHLEKHGLLHPSGHAAIERSKADGSWTALDAVEALDIPRDLASALAERPGAEAEWDGFPPSVRRGILEWILDARRPETRAKRIAETADKAARGERANQWR